MPNIPQANAKNLVIDDLSKGLNTYDPASRVGKGFYVDCENMLLTGKTPVTVGGLTKFNTTTCPNSGVIVWFEPYTDSSATTTMIVADDTGRLYKYVVGTDTWTTLRTGLTTGYQVWTHVPFRGTLVLSSGLDEAPYKYDGTNAIPVGSLLVADFESDETWSGGSADTTNFREGVRGWSIAGAANAFLAYSPVKDFLTGINGATNFAATDLFRIKAIRTAGAGVGTVRFRFGDAASAAYFEATTTVTSATFTQVSLARSAFAVGAGAPVWSSIARLTIYVDTVDTITFDDCHWQYLLRPPVGGLVELYNQQLVVSAVPADRVAIYYSDPGTIDIFPAANFARFSGGRHALEKRDEITALRSYFDELIVGKVNSGWTFSGTGSNTSISALPLTIGIDGHRGIVETPWSLQFSFENNIFGARLTSRGLISSNISSLLASIDGTHRAKIISLRHDRTHTVRWAFRTTTASPATSNDLGLIYDYQLDAWASKYTPKVSYYTRGVISGVREILCSQYDGYIRRVDVGTTFDGTAIVSYVTLPYLQTDAGSNMDTVSRWLRITGYVSGTATVNVDARFADDPSEFETASFTTYGSITATPDGDKGFAYLGVTSRWIQVRFRATSGAFTLQLPVVIDYLDTDRRV